MQIEVVGDTLCALVTAAVLASTGNKVLLKMPAGEVASALLRQQEFYLEPDLQRLLNNNAARLSYQDIASAIDPSSEAVFFALDPQQELQAQQLVQQLQLVNKNLLVVNQSSFPLGSSEKFAQQLPQHHLLCLPDFIREGDAIRSFTEAKVFIVGHNAEQGVAQLREILRFFLRGNDSLLLMPWRDAEFTKLANSGMLATRVTYMNDLAGVAEKLGVDIENVRLGIGSDPRIGASYLNPGCGFGGLSFSHDVAALIDTATKNITKSNFFKQILLINEAQKELLFRKLWQFYQADLAGKTVAIWGVAFKPNTAKIDNAPALKIIDALLEQQVLIRVHDPLALTNLRKHYGENPYITYCEQQYKAVEGAAALLLLTEWQIYWNPDFLKMKQLMQQPLILDGRNIYNPDRVKDNGFTYLGIGRN